jgi:uncharacterized protein DUF1905
MPRRRGSETRGPFRTTLVRYPGKGGWTFAQIPPELAPPITRGWGRTPVHAVVDDYGWDTSIWRSSGSKGAVLAVPKRARGAKGHGDVVMVTFTFERDD